MSADGTDALKKGIEALKFCQEFSDTEIPTFSPNLKKRLRQLLSMETFTHSRIPSPGAYDEFPVLLRPPSSNRSP